MEEELGEFVKSLSEEMHAKFAAILENVVGKIDSMTTRIEELEKSIAEDDKKSTN